MGKSLFLWPFSIAMLVYRRVTKLQKNLAGVKLAPTSWSSPWTAWNLVHIVKLLLAVTAANSNAWSSWRCRCESPRVPTSSKGGERKYSQKKTTRYIQIQNDSFNRKDNIRRVLAQFHMFHSSQWWPFSCCNMAQSPVDASSLFLAGRCERVFGFSHAPQGCCAAMIVLVSACSWVIKCPHWTSPNH